MQCCHRDHDDDDGDDYHNDDATAILPSFMRKRLNYTFPKLKIGKNSQDSRNWYMFNKFNISTDLISKFSVLGKFR